MVIMTEYFDQPPTPVTLITQFTNRLLHEGVSIGFYFDILPVLCRQDELPKSVESLFS
jgi:hypothetical protein